MAVRPEATPHQRELMIRGTGQLGSTLDYLKHNDPATYKYLEFKRQGNKYVNDAMWTEAAIRGELPYVIDLLEQQPDSNPEFDKWKEYGSFGGYDGYVVSLAQNLADDTSKTEKERFVTLQDGTEMSIGSYTDKKYYNMILTENFAKYDAEKIQEDKKNMSFLQDLGGHLLSGVSHLTSGAIRFIGTILNIGEGLVNVLINESNESGGLEDRFMWAFANDTEYGQDFLVNLINNATYDFERRYTSIVDAKVAYEEGYRPGEGNNIIEQTNNAIGVGVSYNGWGKYWVALTDSIGFMLPTMLIPVGAFTSGANAGFQAGTLGAAGFQAGKAVSTISAATAASIKTGIFYAGIFSSNIRETIITSGVSYKDLNGGEVIVNAALKASAQLAVEKLLGAVLGFSGLDRLMGISTKTRANVIPDVSATGIKAWTQVGGRVLKDSLKEGLEEFFQDFSDGLIDTMFGSITTGPSRDAYLKQAEEAWTFENMMDSFVVGALTSGLISAVSNMSVVLPSNREVAFDEKKGELYRLGVAQTLNYRQALRTMYEWSDTLRDAKADTQAKADAALKLSIAMNNLGSVLRHMGMDRALKANDILMQQSLNEETKEAALKEMSKEGYADSLFKTALTVIGQNKVQYKVDKLQKAINKEIDKLVEKQVSKVESVISEELNPNDPNQPIDSKFIPKLKTLLKDLGVDLIVGINGAVTIKSGDILFVDNKLIQKGDIAEIIKGVTYEQVQKSVASSLNANQTKLLVNQYQKITGTEGTIDEAITTLLFDKKFYTKMLLLTSESRSKYKHDTIMLFSTINSIIENATAEQVTKGEVAAKARNILLKKVYDTMRAGLTLFATQYVNLDLDDISLSVLPKDLKAEIKAHRNVIFTNFINDSIIAKTPTTKRIQAAENLFNRYSDQLTKDEFNEAKRKLRSTDGNDQVDVFTLLTHLTKSSSDQSDKLVYLSTNSDEQIVTENIVVVEDFFGISWRDLIVGKDMQHLSKEAKDYIQSNGYDMSDESSRLAAVRDVLFTKSCGQFTIGLDGTLLKVVEKSEFVKKEYLGKDGAVQFVKDYTNGKVKTVKDIAQEKVSKKIGNIKIKIDLDLNNANGYFDNKNTIIIGGAVNTQNMLNVIMHEITHATQLELAVGINTIEGGSISTFSTLPKSVLNSLTEYIKKTFPLTYKYMQSRAVTIPQLVYFMLAGELQANSTLSTHMFEVGFKFKDNRSVLVSPDGKQTWQLKTATSQIIEQTKKLAETRKLQEEYKEVKAKAEPKKETKVNKVDKVKDESIGEQRTKEKLNLQGFELARTKYGEDGLKNDTNIVKTFYKGTLSSPDGYLLMSKRNNEYYVELMETRENKRQTGIGRELIEQAKKYVLAHNDDILKLFSWSTESDKFYEKLGFIRQNKTQFYLPLDNKNLQYDKTIGDSKDRANYVSNKIAQQSNLKYWIQKGIPIQVNPNIQDFVVSTTKDFDKLPKVIRNQIQNGKLTKRSLIHYVSTTNSMNDYTFKAIAEYMFKNQELAKITFKEMQKLMDNIEGLSAMIYLTDERYTKMSPANLEKVYKTALDKAKTDESFSNKLVKALKKTQVVKIETQTAKGKNKISFVESHADTKQLNSSFFRYYDGTISSLWHINTLGKFVSLQQQELSFTEEGKMSDGTWNWVSNKKLADIDYEVDDVSKTLDSLSKEEKIQEIENNMSEVLSERLLALPQAKRIEIAESVMKKYQDRVDQLHKLSDEEIDRRYLKVIANEAETVQNQKILDSKSDSKKTSQKNLKDHLRNLGRTISSRLNKLKSRYNILSPDVKKYIDPNTYTLTKEYQNLTDVELKKLIESFKADAKILRERISLSQRSLLLQERSAKAAEKLAKNNLAKTDQTKKVDTTGRKDINAKGTEIDSKTHKKTLKEKVQVQYKTTIKEQNFEFVTPTEANGLVKGLLKTSWDKTRMSEVQGLTNNRETNVANAKQFFEQNAMTIIGASLTEIEDAAKWFMDARMNNVTDEEYKKFRAIKTYFLGYILSETKDNRMYSDMSHNLKQRIENNLLSGISTAGTELAVWNNIKGFLDPLEVMKSMDMEIDGVLITDSEKDDLFSAANSGDIEAIKNIQSKIIQRVEKEKTSKKSIWRKITTIRSMAMLSSPLTALRNKVSNMALKRLNKIASAIGNKLWVGKHQAGQLSMRGNITPEIQSYINKHFIDNNLFDTLVSNLSRYNPSDISKQFKDVKGVASKDAIFAQLVVKSLYNEYYNSHMFNNKFLNSLHAKLMQALSDNSYIREASVRYFGHLLAEKGYDLSKDVVTDNIMNDFAVAIGLGLSDYMHDTNMFNQIETWLSTSSDSEAKEMMLFAYKTILPFAAASWQWAKAALKLSPLGLVRAIFNMSRLEKRVAYAQDAWSKGTGKYSPDLIEYISRRDLGIGVIGTMGTILGMILAGLGYVDLRDDDYGNPKLTVGNLRIDVSSIFGSSSFLAGAGLITSFNENGITFDSLIEGLNRAVDVTIDGIPLMQIVEMDMYSKGGFSMGMDQLESIALSFIPNILSWIAGGTYSGVLKKTSFFGKAAAKIPFLGAIVNEKRVDPYTGEQGSWLDALNRVIPYFSIDVASQTEKNVRGLGLNKKELRGQYTVNGEEFNITGKELTTINQMYGKWNAIDIEKFYLNQMSVKIKDGNNYKTLTFNQMTDVQRKSAVQTIMTNNSELAKIYAWTSKGYKYYASASQYALLRQRGITSNVYRGTKGFEK